MLFLEYKTPPGAVGIRISQRGFGRDRRLSYYQRLGLDDQTSLNFPCPVGVHARDMALVWPKDPISLEIRQAGTGNIVTSLHPHSTGEAWTAEEVLARRQQIEAA